MNTLKLIISIGLLSSYFVLVSNANADLFMAPDFYQHGGFTNDDFRLSDDNLPRDYSNYYQSDRMYHSDYTVTDVNGYYREDYWDQGTCY